LLIGSEIPERLALSHRIGIMREGRLSVELDARTTSEEENLRLALPDTQSKTKNLLQAQTAQRERPLRRMVLWLIAQREASIAFFIAALLIIFGLGVPSFLTWKNLSDVLVNNSMLLIGSLGMTFVILSGGIDISVVAILVLSAVAAGKADLAGMPAPIVAVSALL